MQLRVVPLLVLGIFHASSIFAAPSVIKATPSALTYSYQEGATLPPVQVLTVAPLTGSTSVAVAVQTGGSQWLTISTIGGRTSLAITVAVNPTSLAIGQYSETITLSTPETSGDPVLVVVSLTVRGAPTDLRLSPVSFSATYRLGDAYTNPASQFLNLTTTGGLLSYTAVPTGTKWLSVSPSTGAVFPGFRTSVILTVDPVGLSPGAYKGSITVSSPTAVTKTVTIPFTLALQPGVPAVTSIWPPKVAMGSPDTSITVNGQRFYSGTTVKSGSTALKATILGPNAMIVNVPASLLASPMLLPLTVSNPDTGGGSAEPASLRVLPPGPILLAVVNGASQKLTSVAPGMLITLYGTGLGPETLVPFDGNSGVVDHVLAGTRVIVDGRALPIVYTSARQVSAAAPNLLDPNKPFFLQVEYNGAISEPLATAAAPAAPAIFTVDGTGTGPAAAFLVDPVTTNFTLNSDKTPSPKGSVLVLYVTGAGVPAPAPPDGQIPDSSSNSVPDVTLFIGDARADVQYVGLAPGLLPSILQLVAVVPVDSPVGKSIPITLKVGTASSQPGVTISVSAK